MLAGAESARSLPRRLANKFSASAEGRGVKLPGKRRRKNYTFEIPTPSAVDPESVRLLLANGRQQLPLRQLVNSSIVIPVFNKAEFTRACLYALLREIDLAESEIIVVDNASTDDTAETLAQFGDLIQVIRNEENRGFVDACNQGAAAARGEFLIFLNNDTEVLSGWLSNLLATIESDASVGAVGSMFLYPDGTIQEAGSIVWRNGEAHHYGWSGDPNDRRFNFAREVDYCSAASLLIRKEIFDQLGGFDRRFAPAYYEDVDLCFGARSLGYKVMYQPASRLIHYEGATAGRDVKEGFKHFQITNREKFVAKWRAVLAREHLKKDLRQLTAAALRLAGNTTLVFDERVPSPDRDAGSARMFMILKALKQRGHVIFVPYNRPQASHYEEALWREGIETANAEDYRHLLKTRSVQAAIISRPAIAEAFIPRIRRANQAVTIVFDMVDAYFIRLGREAIVSGSPETAKAAQRYSRLEKRLARSSDLVWCNSSEDKQVMQTEVPGKRIEVIPTIHSLHERGKAFYDRHDLLFVGNLAHAPNADGVHFFMREIFPLLDASLPQVNIFLVGGNDSEEFKAYNSERVQLTGYLPDLEPLWRGCRVFIAPLRFGAGVKGKTGEAMSYGLPVVTTSVGAEGFGATNEVSALIADEPTGFAAAIVRLYSDQDLWERLAVNGQRLIAENFTPEIVAATINNSLQETIASKQ